VLLVALGHAGRFILGRAAAEVQGRTYPGAASLFECGSVNSKLLTDEIPGAKRRERIAAAAS
jgi:hypothetical protein